MHSGDPTCTKFRSLLHVARFLAVFKSGLKIFQLLRRLRFEGEGAKKYGEAEIINFHTLLTHSLLLSGH